MIFVPAQDFPGARALHAALSTERIEAAIFASTNRCVTGGTITTAPHPVSLAPPTWESSTGPIRRRSPDRVAVGEVENLIASAGRLLAKIET